MAWADEMAALHRNWDSYDGLPVAEAVLTTIRCISLVPTPDGGVQIEWHAHGWDVEIELHPDGTVGGVYVEKQYVPPKSWGEKFDEVLGAPINFVSLPMPEED